MTHLCFGSDAVYLSPLQLLGQRLQLLLSLSKQLLKLSQLFLHSHPGLHRSLDTLSCLDQLARQTTDRSLFLALVVLQRLQRHLVVGGVGLTQLQVERVLRSEKFWPIDMHSLAAASCPRQSEAEPKLFLFETSCDAFCGRYFFEYVASWVNMNTVKRNYCIVLIVVASCSFRCALSLYWQCVNNSVTGGPTTMKLLNCHSHTLSRWDQRLYQSNDNIHCSCRIGFGERYCIEFLDSQT